jgi:hypothetical protein
MNFQAIFIAFLLLNIFKCSEPSEIELYSDLSGHKLQVGGSDFFICGMNWKYYPIGKNYEYQLWDEEEGFIRKALEIEMKLLKDLGVNTIRHYTDVPPEWISYIYKTYGIYAIVNHSFGRYGLKINNQWVAQTNYADPDTRNLLLSQITEMVNKYQGTEGLIFYMLGNENNYGLHWEGAETEDIPNANYAEDQARSLYQLFNEAAKICKKGDNRLPVAICNGDTLYLNLIAQECKDVDILGINVYRGISLQKLFDEVKIAWDKPVVLTEFGADAYHSIENREDQINQARYLFYNWQEVYENVAGLNAAKNSIGGFTFQFTDGWWKTGQTKNLTIQDSTASWSNGGYLHDFMEGQNNMNEEWFGICAKGTVNRHGMYPIYPRKAFYLLQEIHRINPYGAWINAQILKDSFSNIYRRNDWLDVEN